MARASGATVLRLVREHYLDFGPTLPPRHTDLEFFPPLIRQPTADFIQCSLSSCPDIC